MADPEMIGTPVTTHPKPGSVFGRNRAQAHLDNAALLDSHRQLLDHLVGLEKLTHALEQLVIVEARRVLWSGTATLDANGIWTVNLPRGTRAIFVVNVNTNGQLVVYAGPRAGSAPGPGPGVHIVPAGVAAGFNNQTTDWSLYGTAGNNIDVQIFSVPITPSATGAI